MVLASWMYVSISLLSTAEVEMELGSIVAFSRDRNDALDVTGALMFTGRHFAQFIEGPEPGVAMLRDTIVNDGRHADLLVLSPAAVAGRRFTGWSLAYAGPSPLVARVVEATIAADAGRDLRSGDSLLRLLTKFSPLT